MGLLNYAAIDIGSNAVRLLIKKINREETGDSFTKVQLIRVPLRLGDDTYSSGEISDIKKEKLIRLMKAFRQLMKIYDVTDYRACATAAMRDAKNTKGIVKKIAEKSGIKVDVISGQEEARIIYENHIEYILDPALNYLFVDVGGGSTEINLICQGELKSSNSYDIGTIRTLLGSVKKEESDALQSDLKALAETYPKIHIIGSGGNINKLYRLVANRNQQRQTMSVSALQKLNDTMKEMTTEERMKKYKLKPDRADVIVIAADIFLAVARQMGTLTIIVPTIGLSDGIIDGIYAQNKTKKKEKQENDSST